MTFSAALFDMDGLLVDSERTIMNTWIDVSNAHGVTLTTTDYLQIVGRSFAEGHPRRLIGNPDTFDAVRIRVREQLAAPEPHPKFPLKPGAFALLDALAQAGIPCAVASSSACGSSARDSTRSACCRSSARSRAATKSRAASPIRPSTGSRPNASACRPRLRRVRGQRLRRAIGRRRGCIGHHRARPEGADARNRRAEPARARVARRCGRARAVVVRRAETQRPA